MEFVENITTSTPTAALEKWVDLNAVCEHIGFSPNTVRKLVQEGKIPAYPLLNGARTHLRFHLSEVDAAIKSGRAA